MNWAVCLMDSLGTVCHTMHTAGWRHVSRVTLRTGSNFTWVKNSGRFFSAAKIGTRITCRLTCTRKYTLYIQDVDECWWSCASEVVDEAVDTATGVSMFTSVANGDGDEAVSVCPVDETLPRPVTTVSETSSIDGHEVPAGTLLKRSFNAFNANCLLCASVLQCHD